MYTTMLGCIRIAFVSLVCVVACISAADSRADGTVQWSVRLQSPPNASQSAARDFVQLKSGNLIALYGHESEADTEVLVYVSPTGQTVWRRALTEILDPYSLRYHRTKLHAIEDPGGDVIIAFHCSNAQVSGDTCYSKLSKVTGLALWFVPTEWNSRAYTEVCRLESNDQDGFYTICEHRNKVARMTWEGRELWQAAVNPKPITALPNGDLFAFPYENPPAVPPLVVLDRNSGARRASIPYPIGCGPTNALWLPDGGFVTQAQCTPVNVYPDTIDRLTRYASDGRVLWIDEERLKTRYLDQLGSRITYHNGVLIRAAHEYPDFYSVAVSLSGSRLWRHTVSQQYYETVSTALGLLRHDGYFTQQFPRVRGVNPANGIETGYVFDIPTSITQIAFSASGATTLSSVAGQANLVSRYDTPSTLVWTVAAPTIRTSARLRFSTSDVWFMPPAWSLPCEEPKINAASQRIFSAFDATNSYILSVTPNGTAETLHTLGSAKTCAGVSSNGNQFTFLGSDRKIQWRNMQGSPVGESMTDANSWSGGNTRLLENGTAVAFQPYLTPPQPVAWLGTPGVAANPMQSTVLSVALTRVLQVPGNGIYAYTSPPGISRIGADGKTSWHIALPNACFVADAHLDTSGDLLVVSNSCDGRSASLDKISSSGAVLWTHKSEADTTSDRISFGKLVPTTSGVIVIGGHGPPTSVLGTQARGLPQTLAVKVDTSGLVVWQRRIDVVLGDNEWVDAVLARADGVVVAVSSSAECAKSVLITLAADGTVTDADASSLRSPLMRATHLQKMDSDLLVFGEAFLDRGDLPVFVRRVNTSVAACNLALTGVSYLDSLGLFGQQTLYPLLTASFGFSTTRGYAAEYAHNFTCTFGPEIVAANAENAVRKPLADGKFAFDVDGDGKVNPLTDGLILSRAVAGVRGSALTSGIQLSATATRRTGAEIESYLQQCGISLAP